MTQLSKSNDQNLWFGPGPGGVAYAPLGPMWAQRLSLRQHVPAHPRHPAVSVNAQKLTGSLVRGSWRSSGSGPQMDGRTGD